MHLVGLLRFHLCIERVLRRWLLRRREDNLPRIVSCVFRQTPALAAAAAAAADAALAAADLTASDPDAQLSSLAYSG